MNNYDIYNFNPYTYPQVTNKELYEKLKELEKRIINIENLLSNNINNNQDHKLYMI